MIYGSNAFYKSEATLAHTLHFSSISDLQMLVWSTAHLFSDLVVIFTSPSYLPALRLVTHTIIAHHITK